MPVGPPAYGPGDASPGQWARYVDPTSRSADIFPWWYIRRRRLVAVGLFGGLLILYMQRVCMSVAAGLTRGKRGQPQTMVSELGWSDTQQGLLIGSFCAGYVLSNFPCIPLIDRFGAYCWLLCLMWLHQASICLMGRVDCFYYKMFPRRYFRIKHPKLQTAVYPPRIASIFMKKYAF